MKPLLLLASATGILPLRAEGAGDFIEEEQPLIRSALVVSEKRARRLGEAR